MLFPNGDQRNTPEWFKKAKIRFNSAEGYIHRP
jgi:hypothetical protein